jgi:dUTP pyrophosphatase|tara:strand:- start:984 stop:1430 length:447 start_codon:yes stop_codon:yes gene_type:complete
VIIEYRRLDEYVKPPTRSNPSDAGLDVYANLEEETLIHPGDSIIIPTGLKFGVPHGYMLQVMNRSSIAAKRSLMVGAHVIDSGYDGEVFINLHNVGADIQTVKYGDKIAQLVMVPVVAFRPRLIGEDLYRQPITISNRGDGALGSTGG